MTAEFGRTSRQSTSAAPGGDAGSRFVEWLDRADSWQAIGDQARATGAIDRSLETSFGVGYRKDYQLERWLDWLGRINRLDPAEAPARIARIAGSLKSLDDFRRASDGVCSHLLGTGNGDGIPAALQNCCYGC